MTSELVYPLCSGGWRGKRSHDIRLAFSQPVMSIVASEDRVAHCKLEYGFVTLKKVNKELTKILTSKTIFFVKSISRKKNNLVSKPV